jgi:integrase
MPPIQGSCDPQKQDRSGREGGDHCYRARLGELPCEGREKLAAGHLHHRGPLFRSVTKGGKFGNSRLTDKSVAGIIKSYARRIGLNEADFSGHSLRSGFLTSAARRGASVFKMRDVSRHKSMDVLQSYIRDAELFRDHAGAGLL